VLWKKLSLVVVVASVVSDEENLLGYGSGMDGCHGCQLAEPFHLKARQSIRYSIMDAWDMF
jgi:hypothetical protein